MRAATLSVLVALAASPAAFALEFLLPGPAAGWGMSDAWQESIARTLGAARVAVDSPSLDADSHSSLDFDEEARRVRVRASSHFSPRVALSLPVWTTPDGRSGIDLGGQARRPRTGLQAGGLADRTLWNATVEAWRDIGPLTAYAGAGTGRSSDPFDPGRAERSAYSGLELAGTAGTWRLETGLLRGDPVFGTERDTRLAWKARLAPGWSLGIEASRTSAPGWSDRSAQVSLRGRL